MHRTCIDLWVQIIDTLLVNSNQSWLMPTASGNIGPIAKPRIHSIDYVCQVTDPSSANSQRVLSSVLSCRGCFDSCDVGTEKSAHITFCMQSSSCVPYKLKLSSTCAKTFLSSYRARISLPSIAFLVKEQWLPHFVEILEHDHSYAAHVSRQKIRNKSLEKL